VTEDVFEEAEGGVGELLATVDERVPVATSAKSENYEQTK
jgi:hypothetical protein